MSAELVTGDVAAMLASYGERLRWLHIADSRALAGRPGFPDFVIVGARGLIFRECKPHRGSKLAPSQTAWRWALMAAGADYEVWTAADLASGEIRRQLDALAEPHIGGCLCPRCQAPPLE